MANKKIPKINDEQYYRYLLSLKVGTPAADLIKQDKTKENDSKKNKTSK